MRRGTGLLIALATATPVAPGTAHAQASAIADARTPSDTADSPTIRRLRELLDVVNRGDAATLAMYMKTNSISARTGTWDPFLLQVTLDLYRLSRGVDLVRIATIGQQDIQPRLAGTPVAILRNRATGDEQAFAIVVEAAAPHRITGMPVLHPALIATLVRPALSAARFEQERLQVIGDYLTRLADADIFSGVVVIARDGEPVLSRAHGHADRERKVPNTLATPFLLGSMTKLFTGLAIGQLVEQGRLSYDDPLSKFLPDYPDPESARRIRIKHLLTHTSGLLPGFTNKAYHDALDRLHTVQALIDVSERKPPQFEPGTKWAYSNMGFVLLGRVIEVVTGTDYYDYMARHVFAPAGMTSTSFPLLPGDGIAVAPMAYPYEVEFDGERQHYVNKLGAEFRRGGPSCCSVASALDLVRLSGALQRGLIVTPETFRLHSSAKPELGALRYGYGFAVGMRGAGSSPLIGHGGNAAGQCTEFGTLKGTPYTIIVLSNLTIGTCVGVAAKIMRVLAPTAASGGSS